LAATVALSCLAPVAQAQTFMTIKPFVIRMEVPPAVAGTYYLTNCNLRIPTNGATGVDGTGTNWVIASVNVSISGAPAGCTASLVDSGLVNPIGAISVNLNTNNTAMNTNLNVKLVFDGTQVTGLSTLTIKASGAGLPDDPFFLPVDVAKIWNGSPNAVANGAGTWSAGPWLGGALATGDNVVFNDLGTQTNQFVSTATTTNFLTNIVVDVSTAISSLRFAVTNGTGTPKTNYHNIYINPGQNLAINGPGGFKILRDYAYWSVAAEIISIYGTNGTFIQTNESSSFSILSDGQAATVLDMSRLSSLYLDVNRLFLSDYLGYPNYYDLEYTNNYVSTTAGAGKPQRFYQTWDMAGTNYVKATYVDPNNYTNSSTRTYALTLGHNEASGGGSGKDVEMFLGYSNVFNLDSICVADSFCLGADFQFLNTNSYAKFRNADGVSRMSIFATADSGGPTQASGVGDNTKCGGSGPGVDFTKGTVDMQVDRLYLSLDRTNVTVSGKGVSQTSGFQFAAGTIDANTAILGYQSQGDQTNQSYCYANMVVSNTALFRVNNNLALGYSTCSTAGANAENNGYGQIAIGPGGTVIANTVTVGGVTKLSGAGGSGKDNHISMFGNASLIVSNTIADSTPGGALGSFNMSGGNNSLTLFVDGSLPPVPIVYVTNLTSSGTGNKLIIGGIKNETYPANIPLIIGMGSATIAAASFGGGVVMPTGSGLHGTLVDSSAIGTSSNTIILQVINRTPNHLVWRAPMGSGTANWDYTTKNWLDQNTGLMTNYDNPDIVAFDDAAGYATNILISGATSITPTVVNMTNNNLYYTFMDGGNQIIGGPALNKYGTGTNENDANTSFSAQVNQGTLVGSGAIGNVNIAGGAVMDYSGPIAGSVACSGTGTSSDSIAGSLTVLSGGVMTNSGAANGAVSVQSGGFLYNSAAGTMPNIGVGSSGGPQVAKGGTFVNNGAIGVNLGGEVLYVNGTFEDVGGGSDSIYLQSVTIGAGGTFLPGGGTTGTTTINSDGTGTFPGAALLVQGSTNIFEINVAGAMNTVLSLNDLSFGASSSQRSQLGCTLMIVNTSLTPFSAGQSFHLFDNVNNPGTVPYSTGSSTNTYPVIVPPSPGAGLSWDLSQLWQSGNIGIAGANSGPTLTNNFAGDGTGTNIVAQFSWDSSKIGYRLETLVAPLTIGLSATNWAGVSGSWTNTAVTLTNVITTNSVFYRLSFP
jgi:hypothetical protein